MNKPFSSHSHSKYLKVLYSAFVYEIEWVYNTKGVPLYLQMKSQSDPT